MNFGERSSVTPVLMKLLIAHVGIYVLMLLPFIGDLIIRWGALVPYPTFLGGQVWRLATYMFLHDPSTPFHLLFNMLALWMFGQEIESRWGSRQFTFFYFFSGIGSGVFSLVNLFSPVMQFTPVIGASGAVLALLTVYAYYYPDRKVLLFFILPINIRLVVLGYALFSLYGSIAPHGVISHLTHLGGILIAIAYLRWYPKVSGWLVTRGQLQSERSMRQRAESAVQQRHFFEDVIDPILEKISRDGEHSLSPQERNLLKKVAQSKDRDQLKKNKIVPFDPFK